MEIKKTHLNIIIMTFIVLAVGFTAMLFFFISKNNKVESVGGNNEQVFTLTAERFKYTPSTIRVKQGETVVINVTNKDFNHGISIPDYNVIGQDKVTFVATKKGTFSFGCTLFCGTGHNEMSGQLIVE